MNVEHGRALGQHAARHAIGRPSDIMRWAMLPAIALLAACAAAPASAQQLRFVTYRTASGLGNNSTYGVFTSGSTVYAATLSGFGIGSPQSPVADLDCDQWHVEHGSRHLDHERGR